MEIIFATANNHKLKEAQAILGDKFTLIMPKELGHAEEIPETGTTLEENSMQKCKSVKEMFGKNCFADDTGLEVEALDGAPGVFSARYADDTASADSGQAHNHYNNMCKLLSELEKKEQEGEANRRARFKTVVTLYYNGEYHTFEGIVNGTIIKEMKGTNGFGYDPIFVPEGFDCTIAQMSESEKNEISHRGVAMRKLAAFLKNAE